MMRQPSQSGNMNGHTDVAASDAEQPLPGPPVTAKRGRWIAIGVAMMVLLLTIFWFINPFVVLQDEVAVVHVGRGVRAFAFIDDETLMGVDEHGGVHRVEAFPSESSRLLTSAPDISRSVLSIPEKSAFAIGTKDGEVLVVDLDGETLHQWNASDEGMVTALAYSPKCDLLLVAALDGRNDFGFGGTLSLWSLATGEQVAFRSTTDRTPMGVDIVDATGVAVVGFYYGEVSVVSLDDLTTLLEIEIKSIQPRYSLQLHDLTSNSARTLIGVATTDSVIVLDSETLDEVARHPTPGSTLRAVWIDNDELVYCGYDCGVVRWRHATDETIQLADESLTLHCLDISPNGQYIAISRGGRIRVAELKAAE
jgi:hypothetical protein